MRKIALIFVFVLPFISCEKSEPLLIIENTDISLISKVLIGGEIYQEYIYNDANLLNEEKSKFHYAKHTYNDRNELIATDSYWDMRIASSFSPTVEDAENREEWVNPDNTPIYVSHAYKYNEKDQLVSKTYIRHQQGTPGTTDFHLEDGRVVRWSSSDSDGKVTHYGDYTYDTSSNLILEEKYCYTPEGIAELQTTTEYEYDNMHNPFQAFKRFITPGINTNQNNIVKETYTIHFEVDEFPEKVRITENSYEYNADGYPVMVNGETEYVYR